MRIEGMGDASLNRKHEQRRRHSHDASIGADTIPLMGEKLRASSR
jgi:hypothetical protein